MHNPLVAAALVACVAMPAIAQQQPAAQRSGDVKVAQAPDRCRKDVKDYLDTLQFVRQAAGTQIGDRVAGGFLSEAEVERIVAAQGHCAAAQLLREKGTPR